LKKLFGPRHLVWKTATALGVLVIAAMVLWPVTFRVTARAVIEGEEQRVITAPFEGYIAENKPANDKSSPDKSDKVFPGKEVKAGEVLARLDGRELEKELKRWTSEIEQIESRLRQTWGSSELAGKPVLLAQLEQATAQRDLVADKIARLALTAPFAGIVVSGDLRQQVGAPVETGKKLFEIARLNSYRIILQVDERDIAYLSKEQAGRLMMTGIAGEPIDFSVSGVTPVAVAQEGRNFFRVEATIQQGLERLRPGMEGVAKVEIGPRSLWWVMTRSFSDWLRLELWRWLP
jgi:biotin carboxyl carrier protein